MPCGNGDIGLNVWKEENGDLLFYIGKTDSWGDNSRLLKVGRVRVRLSSDPLLPEGYFRQALRLKDGTVEVRWGESSRPIKTQVWVDANHPVIHVSIECPKPLEATRSHRHN